MHDLFFSSEYNFIIINNRPMWYKMQLGVTI